MMILRSIGLTLIFAAAVTFGIAGCSGPANPAASHDDDDHGHDGHDHEGHDHGDHKEDQAAGHVHGEWWCAEHGVPEAECGLCSPKVAAELKKKGDWCADHNRPDSQCFVCHPALEAKFAARYEAKYGKAPPKMN